MNAKTDPKYLVEHPEPQRPERPLEKRARVPEAPGGPDLKQALENLLQVISGEIR